MEEFPSNSQRSKRPPRDEPKINRVIEGEVVRRKKPWTKRLSETFFSYSEGKNLSEYVVFDVLIPAARDMVYDVIVGGLERTIGIGDGRSSASRRRSSGYRSSVPVHHTDYNSRFRREEAVRSPSRRARTLHDFDEIVLDTRVEAEEVLDRMFEIISQYEVVSVYQLYELVGVDPSFTDRKWGWADIRGASVRRVREGYLLDLPRPEPID